MQVVTSEEAQSNFRRLLDFVEAGEEVLISRGKAPVAKLSRVGGEAAVKRPRVGETISPRFVVPDEALAPLSEAELKAWGL